MFVFNGPQQSWFAPRFIIICELAKQPCLSTKTFPSSMLGGQTKLAFERQKNIQIKVEPFKGKKRKKDKVTVM